MNSSKQTKNSPKLISISSHSLNNQTNTTSINPNQQSTQLHTIQYTLNTLSQKFNLQSIQQIAHITLDPQLSKLFKQKYPQFNTYQSNLTQKLQKMSIQHTYHQMYIYYAQFPMYLQQCRHVLQYKYQQDDILRTHNNRKSIWLLCSGALNKIKQNPLFYQKLTQYRIDYPQFFKHTIQKDVVRTVHDKNKQNEQLLSNILRNFAIRNPYIGYCQGMNFIVNFLIMMQFNEQQAFWLCVQLIQNILPKTYYTNMLGVAVDICIIEHYIKYNNEELYEKLQQMNLSLSLFTLQWLVCLFTSTLPFYMLVIVWDMMFIYGPSILLKVCIVILEELQQIILRTDDLSELLIMIQNKKRSIYIQEDKFINRINNIYIDEQLISICRQLIQLNLLKQKAQLSQQQNNNQLKKKQKIQSIQCNIQWPICYQALKQHKSDMGQIQVWTFKQQGSLKIINDYLIIKNKKSYKPIQDNRQQSKRLIIGRIPHYCNVKQYNKKHIIKRQSIELQQYDILNRKYVIQKLSMMSNNVKIFNQQHFSFFRSASNQNLSSYLQYQRANSQQMNLNNKTNQNNNTNNNINNKNYNQQNNDNKNNNINNRSNTDNISNNKINQKQKQKLYQIIKEKKQLSNYINKYTINLNNNLKPNSQTLQNLQRGSKIQETQENQNQNQQKSQNAQSSHNSINNQQLLCNSITNQDNLQIQQMKKTRNPFKKLRNKWRQRKLSKNIKNQFHQQNK